MQQIPDITQRNWNAVHEALRTMEDRIQVLEDEKMNQNRFITNQMQEIKQLHTIIIAQGMGRGPTT